MAPRGYSTRALVSNELGSVLDAVQELQVDGLIEEAESLFDRWLPRPYLIPSPVTAEAHTLVGPMVYLKQAPVLTVSTVTLRSPAVGAVPVTLAAGSEYELIDAERGVLSVYGYPDVITGTTFAPGSILKATYTFTSPSALPADVRRHATTLVASWMRPRLVGGASGATVEAVTVGDVSVRYAKSTTTTSAGTVPDDVMDFLRSRQGVVFA